MITAFYLVSYFNKGRKNISYCHSRNSFVNLNTSFCRTRYCKPLEKYDREISFCNFNFGYSKISSSAKNNIILF